MHGDVIIMSGNDDGSVMIEFKCDMSNTARLRAPKSRFKRGVSSHITFHHDAVVLWPVPDNKGYSKFLIDNSANRLTEI